MEEKFQNEQIFLIFMNVKRLPIHVFRIFARKIDFLKGNHPQVVCIVIHRRIYLSIYLCIYISED